MLNTFSFKSNIMLSSNIKYDNLLVMFFGSPHHAHLSKLIEAVCMWWCICLSDIILQTSQSKRKATASTTKATCPNKSLRQNSYYSLIPLLSRYGVLNPLKHVIKLKEEIIDNHGWWLCIKFWTCIARTLRDTSRRFGFTSQILVKCFCAFKFG